MKVAKLVGRHHATVLRWRQVPAEHVRAVAKASGIPPHEIRPNVFDPPAEQHVPQAEAA